MGARRIIPLVCSLLLGAGCAAPDPSAPGRSFNLFCVSLNFQVGGNRTQPDIYVDNDLAAGATQVHDLPISHDSENPTRVSIPGVKP